MNPKATEIAKKDHINPAKKKGIKEPHKMSTKKLLDILNRYKKTCVIQCSLNIQPIRL